VIQLSSLREKEKEKGEAFREARESTTAFGSLDFATLIND